MIIIPAHNEETSIGRVLRIINQLNLGMEVVVVANNCTDNTEEIAESHQATVLRESTPGYSAALQCGYRYAWDKGADFVVQLDADGQHSPWDIPQLIKASSSVDWVIGSRHKTGTSGSLLRRTGSAFVGHMARLMGVGELYDLSSGFWVFNRLVLSFFIAEFPATVDANLRLMAVKKGFRLIETPVEMFERKTGRSMHQGFTSIQSGFQSINALLVGYYSSHSLSSAAIKETSASDT